MKEFINKSIESYKTELAGKKVMLGLSGGVDSTVTAVLLQKAIGDNLICVFVDTGLMRKNEGDIVIDTFTKKFNLNIYRVNAQERFLAKLSGVADPEEKRKIIGREFTEVFAEAARKLSKEGIEYLAQGTIYPDVLESGKDADSVIKSHHNVGGLPDDLAQIGFKGVVEPLRELYKGDVRRVGEELGIPRELVWRQPFPGPGLGVRVIGEITAEKVRILQDADAIVREELDKSGLDLNQYFAVIPGVKAVGVANGKRTYQHVIAIRAITTTDFMEAKVAQIPYELLFKITNRIIAEVDEVNRVVYDITPKPPGTVEWE